MNRPAATARRIAKFRFVDDGIGGFHASYGIGVANTDWDCAVLGCGRSPREAADDAIEQLATAETIAPEDLERLDAELDTFDDSQESVCRIELEIAEDVAMERFGKSYAQCSPDERAEVEEDTMNGEPVETAVALFVKWEADR